MPGHRITDHVHPRSRLTRFETQLTYYSCLVKLCARRPLKTSFTILKPTLQFTCSYMPSSCRVSADGFSCIARFRVVHPAVSLLVYRQGAVFRRSETHRIVLLDDEGFVVDSWVCRQGEILASCTMVQFPCHVACLCEPCLHEQGRSQPCGPPSYTVAVVRAYFSLCGFGN